MGHFIGDRTRKFLVLGQILNSLVDPDFEVNC